MSGYPTNRYAAKAEFTQPPQIYPPSPLSRRMTAQEKQANSSQEKFYESLSNPVSEDQDASVFLADEGNEKKQQDALADAQAPGSEEDEVADGHGQSSGAETER